jgi:hypothetical protein
MPAEKKRKRKGGGKPFCHKCRFRRDGGHTGCPMCANCARYLTNPTCSHACANCGTLDHAVWYCPYPPRQLLGESVVQWYDLEMGVLYKVTGYHPYGYDFQVYQRLHEYRRRSTTKAVKKLKDSLPSPSP